MYVSFWCINTVYYIKKVDTLLTQVLSRLGHMFYDVVGARILQTGIPESKCNLIGITKVSVAILTESVLLGFAIIANDVSHFGSLAMLSLSSVIAATLSFCQWLGNPTDAQISLFNFDPQFWLYMWVLCSPFSLSLLAIIIQRKTKWCNNFCSTLKGCCK